MRINRNRELFIALFILCTYSISCEAQTTSNALFEPAESSPIAMTCSPGNVAAGDLNKDGKPDLVLTCSQNRSLTLFKARGNGRFDPFPNKPLLLPYPPNEMAIGDMNSDGYADLVIASHNSYSVLILPGDGNGNFIVPTDSVIMKKGSHPHTHGLGIGDLNGDNYPDIVTANNADNDITVMLNKGSGSFIPAPGSPFSVSPSPYPLTIGDLNGDGHLDIVSTSTHESSRVLTLLLGNGQGHFRRSDIPLRTASPWFVSIGDINKDQIPDMVVTHSERHELTVLLGSGNGRFTEVAGSPFNLNSNAWHVAIADVNRDGNPDVLAAANNGVRVFTGDGSGQFVAAPASPFLTGKGTWHLAVIDVNGDTRPDVVTSNLESKNVSVLLGR